MQPERVDMKQDLGALSGSRASTEPSSTVSALTGFDPARWLEIGAEQFNASALLYLGESIPDQPFLIVGTRIMGEEAESLGYREFAKYGGWLIWHQEGNDFYVIDADEPLSWLPLDAIAIEARQRTDTEEGLDPKGESAGPQDIAQSPSQ